MLTQSDTFFILLLIPLTLMTLIFLLREKKGGSTMDKQSRFSHFLPWKKRTDADATCQIIDKRQHARINLSGTMVNVTDGCIFCTALVDNVSTVGICLSKLPESLYKKADSLTIFSSNNDRMPTIHVQPKWEKSRQHGKTLGAIIVDVSEEWTTFLTNSVRPYSANIL